MTTSLPNSTVNPESAPAIKKKRSFGEMILNNWQQKLGALFCSLLLFVVVSYDRNMTANFEKIPVVFKMPDGFVTRNGAKETMVDVKVYGRASLLRKITRDEIGVITITPAPREGNVQVTLQNNMISLPDGVRIEKFSPEFIGFDLEPLEQRTVAVSTDHAFTGELAPGFQLGEVRIVPAEIEISGPRSAIAATSQLYIDPIDLTGKVSTFTVNRWIIRDRVGVTPKSEQVEVTVNIVSKSRQHVFIGVPIKAFNLDSSYHFEPSTVDITLVGDEASLAKIDASKFLFTLNVPVEEALGRLLTASDFTISNLPAGVEFDKDKFPTVMLKVSKSDNKPDSEPLDHE